MKPSEILEKAVVVATRLDHCKGDTIQPSGPPQDATACCTLGATWIASGVQDSEASEAADKFVRRYLFVDEYEAIGCWNDLPTTTKEDVIKALQGGLDLAKAAGC